MDFQSELTFINIQSKQTSNDIDTELNFNRFLHRTLIWLKWTWQSILIDLAWYRNQSPS